MLRGQPWASKAEQALSSKAYGAVVRCVRSWGAVLPSTPLIPIPIPSAIAQEGLLLPSLDETTRTGDTPELNRPHTD
jgi:hypothetical protein